MAVRYSIDHKSRLLTTIFSGTFTDSDIWQLIEMLRNDPKYDPDFNELIDCSAVTANRVTATALSAVQSAPMPRRAVVAPQGANFGVARMFQILQPNQNIEIFRTHEEALEWLGIDGAKMEPRADKEMLG